MKKQVWSGMTEFLEKISPAWAALPCKKFQRDRRDFKRSSLGEKPV